MRKASLLALTKSNKNLGMRILELERTLSSEKLNCEIITNNIIRFDNWHDEER